VAVFKEEFTMEVTEKPGGRGIPKVSVPRSVPSGWPVQEIRVSATSACTEMARIEKRIWALDKISPKS
jgi:hypothetical protein